MDKEDIIIMLCILGFMMALVGSIVFSLNHPSKYITEDNINCSGGFAYDCGMTLTKCDDGLERTCAVNVRRILPTY